MIHKLRGCNQRAHLNETLHHTDPKVKVLVIVGEYPPQIGGISDYTALLSQGLVTLGFEVNVVTTNIGQAPEQSSRNGVHIQRIISNWHMSEVKSILGIIDGMGSDAIVNLQYGGFANRRRPMVTLLPPILRLLRPRCHVIVTLHEFRAQRVRWRLWTAPMITTAHGLIFVDPPDRGMLLRWTKLRRPRMECIPIAPNIMPVAVTKNKRRTWRHRLGVQDNTPIITFFGGVREGKGIFDLFEAISNLRGDAIPACLLLIGWFELGFARNRKYCERVRDVFKDGLSAGWIKLAEDCAPDVVSEHLHASDVAVFPFVRGVRSNNGSLLAAVAHGLPVIATRGVDTPNGLDEQYGITLVPARNPKALTMCLKEILLSDERKNSLRTRAQQAAKDFSWASIANATATFYDSFKVKDV